MSNSIQSHQQQAVAGFEGVERQEETIAGLRAEVAALQARLSDDSVARQLRDVLAQATITGTIAAPAAGCGLLRTIVQTASYFLSAQAATLFLVDQERQDLVVATALGPKSAQVEQIRVPLGHGIAGLVAATGQPMAVSDVGSDPRHAANISAILGHVPQSILCVPLLYDERVIGVIELFDKEDAAGFSAPDIEALAMFADLAAIAIEQSRKLQQITSLVGDVLEAAGRPSEHSALHASAQAFARRIEEQPAYRRAVELAHLIQEIGCYGEQELEACALLVASFAGYLRARPQTPGGAQQAG